MAENEEPRRKRRTREHVIEDLSENHLELKVLLKGHLLRRPERDYGVDVTMFHFAENPDRVDPEKETANVHIPMTNKLTIASIDHFRKMSLQIVDMLRNQGGFPDITRKPK